MSDLEKESQGPTDYGGKKEFKERDDINKLYERYHLREFLIVEYI